GPHVVSGDYHLFWAYMLAPLAGAAVAASVPALLGAHRVCRARDIHRYHLRPPRSRHRLPASSL
ncbi:hypothetical protein NGM37_25405, partial [Streptomyces sp. TRM76130]|nr:hypothetical protein [Streptomyces sp. TRM76130]